MDRKLYVGGLNRDTSDASLRTHFESCGSVVEARVATDSTTGRSRGFGFVTMTSTESAKQAITDIHDTDFDGCRIRVNRADSAQRDQVCRW